ncbi:MAG: hypothetical protein DHS20C18_34230 [Saprospiraceae bacterium]|nr:MAG: hypothetical protein DHS20C18_34230 [Saprospiraceae bacterium]
MGGVGIIILAAGASRRMGQPKQLLVFDGQTLLDRTIDLARNIQEGPLMVVFGAGITEIRQGLSNKDFSWVENTLWPSGMSSSIRCGLTAILKEHPNLKAILFLLVDQPLIGVDHLKQVLETWRKNQSLIVAARYRETLGVPVLFDRRLFPELLELTGDKGAKPLLKSYSDQLLAIDLPAAALDLDTPTAWQAFLQRMQKRKTP